MGLHERLTKIGVGERGGSWTGAARGVSWTTSTGHEQGCDTEYACKTRHSIGFHPTDPWVP